MDEYQSPNNPHPTHHSGTDHTPEPEQASNADPDQTPHQDARRPDPGSKRAALIALLVFLPLLLMVVISQQTSVQQASEAPEVTEITPPSTGEVPVLLSKVYFKIHETFGPEAQVGSAQNMAQLDAAASGPIDRLRIAIVAGELQGPEAALARLDEVENEVDELQLSAMAPEQATEQAPDQEQEQEYKGLPLDALLEIQLDISWLRDLYNTDSSEESPTNQVSDFEFSKLQDRHGWYGKLASVYDGRNPDLREHLGRGGGLLIAVFLALIIVVVLGFFGGLGLLITGLVMLAMGKIRPRFQPPAPGGSVYLELVAVFVLAFLSVSFAGDLIGKVAGPVTTLRASLGLQWLVLLVIFWPLVRGVSRKRWAHDLGLSLPETGKAKFVFREIGAGLLVYIASIPVYLFAAFVSVALVSIREGINQLVNEEQGPTPTPPNPIIELVANVDILTIALLFLLATVWAPIVEEVVMRGALFRHMRSRVHALIAIPVTALVFGLLHQYDMLMLGPVIALGMMFAFMRHWRSSLIPSISAHFLHNASVLTLLITVVMLLGD